VGGPHRFFRCCPPFSFYALLAQNAVSVEGVVVDSVTGLGLAGVFVQFRSDAGEYQAVTDPSRRFRISFAEAER